MNGKQGERKGRPTASPAEEERGDEDGFIDIERLRRLVRLLDKSEVTELEYKNEEEGTRLVLRKAIQSASFLSAEQSIAPALAAVATPSQDQSTHHTVKAPLVGIFHAWSRPKGGALVSVGHKVKDGQTVATIESLNVINEVETTVAGRVIEIIAQEGQPVEYGQALMVIDSAEGE